MQFLRIAHIENAHIRIVPGNSPKVPPLTFALQHLAALFLNALKLLNPQRIGVMGDANIHADVKQHGLGLSHSGENVDALARAIAAKESKLVGIDGYTQTRPRRHLQ